MHSAGVKRIGDVAVLRDAQFAEDAGPLAHPIRPDRYIEINNFYTGTVYQKGAEVIRMLHTLIGEEASGAACDLYFERHDGQAVTCDDFVRAMADASGRDLGQFMRWYAQAGTPELKVDAQLRPGAAGADARDQPEHARDPGPAREAAVPHPDPAGPGRRATGRRAAAARRRERAQGHGAGARADRGRAELHLPRPGRRAGAVAAARLLRPGEARCRLRRRRARPSDGARQRRVHALGRRPAAGRATCCWRWSRDHAAGRAAGPRSTPRLVAAFAASLDRAPRGPGLRRAGAVAARQRLSRPADGA